MSLVTTLVAKFQALVQTASLYQPPKVYPVRMAAAGAVVMASNDPKMSNRK
jgi:hypothetical protein